MKDERKKMLMEKFKDRSLMTELDYCSEYPKRGYMTNSDSEFYEWLCYAAYQRIRELERQINEEKSRMRLTDLYIRDKYSGSVHRIGDDRHDSMMVDEEGTVHYFHMQCGDGCIGYKSINDEKDPVNQQDFKYGFEFLPSEDGEPEAKLACKHCQAIDYNSIGEMLADCEEWDQWRNASLGDCFGNCEKQEEP